MSFCMGGREVGIAPDKATVFSSYSSAKTGSDPRYPWSERAAAEDEVSTKRRTLGSLAADRRQLSVPVTVVRISSSVVTLVLRTEATWMIPDTPGSGDCVNIPDRTRLGKKSDT